LADAIRAVAAVKQFVADAVVGRSSIASPALVHGNQESQIRKNLGSLGDSSKLIQLVHEGLTNKRDCQLDSTCPSQTIKNHLRRMLRKVGAMTAWKPWELLSGTKAFWT